jgi:solute carrier family 3 protein 2
MKEVELKGLEPEKQPLNVASGVAMASLGGGEKNSLGNFKMAKDDAEAKAAAKSTGLSREELLKMAGIPSPERTCWAPLLLFWLSWL